MVETAGELEIEVEPGDGTELQHFMIQLAQMRSCPSLLSTLFVVVFFTLNVSLDWRVSTLPCLVINTTLICWLDMWVDSENQGRTGVVRKIGSGLG